MFKYLDENKPNFINELGVKWWLDKSITAYCKNKDNNGTILNADVYLIEETKGNRLWLIVKDNAIIEEDDNLEHLGFKIDKLKADIHFK